MGHESVQTVLGGGGGYFGGNKARVEERVMAESRLEVWLRPGLCCLQCVTWGSILASLCLHVLVCDVETLKERALPRVYPV